jgi:hypothetical protein
MYEDKCNTTLINPDFACKYKKLVIHIDSRNRVNPSQTTPSQYTILLPYITNIKQMSLLTSEIYGTDFLINETNNIFQIRNNSTLVTYTVTLTKGNFSLSSLATNLQTAINSATSTVWTITADQSTSTFSYLTPAPQDWRFIFSKDDIARNAGRLLGFPIDTSSTFDFTGVGPFIYSSYNGGIVDVIGDRYVLMVLKAGNSSSYKGIENTQNVGDVFAKIIFNSSSNGETQSFAGNSVVTLDRKIDRLMVEFRKSDGSLYNFRGIHHSFSLECIVNT